MRRRTDNGQPTRAAAGHSYDDLVRRHGSSPEPPPFEDLVRQLSSEVWLLCRHLGDRESAEDLTQETFLRVHTALPGFRGEASPRTWVFAIARRVCADHVRRQRRDRALLAKTAQDAAPGAHPDPAGAVTLWGLVADLSAERRTAFVLTQVFGLAYEEAATVCECPIGTIRSRVARARADLIAASDPTTNGYPERAALGEEWTS